jgi:hypothetical protein
MDMAFLLKRELCDFFLAGASVCEAVWFRLGINSDRAHKEKQLGIIELH